MRDKINLINLALKLRIYLKPWQVILGLHEVYNIKKQIKTYEGDLGRLSCGTEGVALYILAKFGNGGGEVVEIGSFKGRSTIWLARGIKGCSRKITAIDPFEGTLSTQDYGVSPTLGIFKENIKNFGCQNLVNIFAETSEAVANNWVNKIRLIFIDGLHDYDNVKKDYTLWSPFVMSGGFIAFHDYNEDHPGVVRFINNDLKGNDKFVVFPKIGNIFILKKK